MHSQSRSASCWKMFLNVFIKSKQAFTHFLHYKQSSRTPAKPNPGGQAGKDSQGVHGAILVCSHHHTGGAGVEQGGGAGEEAVGQVGLASYRQRRFLPRN